MPDAWRTPSPFQPRWIADRKIPANSRLRVHGRQKCRDRGRDTVDGVGSGSDPDRVHGDPGRGEIGIRVGTRRPRVGKVMAELGTRIPRWRSGFDQGSGHGGQGPDGRLRRAGARWLGRWVDHAEGAAKMDAPRCGADPASGQSAPRRERGTLGARTAWTDADRDRKIAGTGCPTPDRPLPANSRPGTPRRCPFSAAPGDPTGTRAPRPRRRRSRSRPYPGAPSELPGASRPAS